MTEDGAVIKKVINLAIDITANCDCEPSCYKCLRNYDNQKMHNYLDRKEACEFLRQYIGDFAAMKNQNDRDSSI